MEIHIGWAGPYTLANIGQLNRPHDYGVYQIYGNHPVYGSDKLLYIGKASSQTFGVRIKQQPWQFNPDGERINFYIGRLSGSNTPNDDEWDRQIDSAERLLIYAHGPAYNSAGLNSLPESQVRNVHVFNWDTYRDLLPEVSGGRWTSKYDDWPEYDVYNYSGDA